MTLRRIGPEKGESSVEVRDGAVVRDALRAAGIVPEVVLVARASDKQVVPDDEPVRDGEVLLVTRVVTGGGEASAATGASGASCPSEDGRSR